MTCPFGGIPGTYNLLNASVSPPKKGYRVIPGMVWWNLIFVPWRYYIAAQAKGLKFTPPTLAPLGASGVYFTDIESLEGLLSPSDFAKRLGLPPQAHRECDDYGCAVVEFNITPIHQPTLPSPAPGAIQGLTTRGAREWITTGNVELHHSMSVRYIDVALNGSRDFAIPL
jgi:hypothetical protein